MLGLVALCWLVFGVNFLIWQGDLNRFGIIPRHVGSLPGILWAPFLHVSLAHLTANTVPLLVLGMILCARSSSEFLLVAVVGTLLTGALTWVIGRTGSHIGASGLIFCLFGYLASLAWFRRTLGTLVLSLVCIVAYGGMIKGILPTSAAVSWEGHLAGLIGGVVVGYFTSKVKPAATSRVSRNVAVP